MLCDMCNEKWLGNIVARVWTNILFHHKDNSTSFQWAKEIPTNRNQFLVANCADNIQCVGISRTMNNFNYPIQRHCAQDL